jgi:hypothetical protein
MSIKEKTKAIVVIGLLPLLLFVFGFAVMIILNHYRAFYLLPASFATVSLTIAVILPFHQKRISFQSISLLIIAILFIGSGTFKYANDNFLRPLSVLQQIEFSKYMQPNQISSGLEKTGLGIAFLVLGITLNKLKPPVNEVRKKLPFIMFMIVMGFLQLILGISSIFNGLQPL